MSLLNLISKIACILPWQWGYFVLRVLSFVYYLFCRRKFLIIANLRLAFPDLPIEKIEIITRDNLFESALSFWEFLRLRCMNKEDLQEIVEVEADASSWQEIKKGHSIILGVHMGSWEVVNSFFASSVPYVIIARRQKSSVFEKFIGIVRERYNLGIIYEDDLKGLARIMRQNINLGLVFDHGARETKIYANFFYRQVPVPIGPLRLALRFKRKIIPAAVSRKGSKHLVKLFTPLAIEKEEDYLNVANYLNRCFENFIRRNPTGFLWSYKRFKRSKDIQLVVFSDKKAGHKHQALSLAEIISQLGPAKTKLIEVPLNRWQRVLLDILNLLARRPSSLWFWTLKAVLGRNFNAVFHYGDIFISCGSNTASLMRLIALFMGAKTFQILRPNCRRHRYDLIIIPEHDKFTQAKNILRIKGALYTASSEEEKKAGDKLRSYLWRQHVFSLTIGMFIGGPLGESNSEAYLKECQKLVQGIKEFALQEKAGLLITTSRRTPSWLEKMLKEEFSQFDNTLLLLIANEKNYDFAPAGIRTLADGLIVSADSVSMVTEAASRRDTFVLDIFSVISQSSKHRKFLQSLSEGGYIKQISVDDLVAELRIWHEKKASFRRLENDKIIRERLKMVLNR